MTFPIFRAIEDLNPNICSEDCRDNIWCVTLLADIFLFVTSLVIIILALMEVLVLPAAAYYTLSAVCGIIPVIYLIRIFCCENKIPSSEPLSGEKN